MQRLPDGVGALASLEKLDLFGCLALQALPDSLGELYALLHLDTSNCTSLTRLPDTLGGYAIQLMPCAVLTWYSSAYITSSRYSSRTHCRHHVYLQQTKEIEQGILPLIAWKQSIARDVQCLREICRWRLLLYLCR